MTGEEINIYLLLRGKDRSRVERIFQGYNLTLQTDQLMIATKALGDSEPSVDWVEVNSFEDVLNHGLSSSGTCFSAYFQIAQSDFSNMILSFTFDGNVVVGYIWDSEENVEAKTLELAKLYGPEMIAAFVETPPPESEDDFIEKAAKYALYYRRS